MYGNCDAILCNFLCVMKYSSKKNLLLRLKIFTEISTGDNLVVLTTFTLLSSIEKLFIFNFLIVYSYITNCRARPENQFIKTGNLKLNVVHIYRTAM